MYRYVVTVWHCYLIELDLKATQYNYQIISAGIGSMSSEGQVSLWVTSHEVHVHLVHHTETV